MASEAKHTPDNPPRLRMEGESVADYRVAMGWDKPATAPAQRPAMVIAAARVLCERAATQCNVDAEDNWKVYGEDYLQDAEAAINASGALDLLEAARAAMAYDRAIRECAGNPRRMSSYCTADGDDLDRLYADWVTKARVAIAKATGSAA